KLAVVAAIAQADGLRGTLSSSEVCVFRMNASGQVERAEHVPLQAVMGDQGSTKNLLLRPGDIVWVKNNDQPVEFAKVRADALRLQIKKLQEELKTIDTPREVSPASRP